MKKEAQWISPAAALAMLRNDPAGGADDYGFALLRPRVKNKVNNVADLVRAKLQPRQPTKARQSFGSAWPITSHDRRLVLAPGVAEVPDLGAFLSAYDEDRHVRLDPLAVVLTMRFNHDELLHDTMTEASTYAQMLLSQKRRLTSVVVQHVPGQELSWRPPHIHLVVLTRTHHPSGFGAVHPMFAGDEADAHRTFREEWRSFRQSWRSIAKDT